MFPSCRRLPPPLPAVCSLGQSPRFGPRAVHGPGCQHEKTLPAPGSEGFGGRSPMLRGAIERPHPSSLWPDTAIPRGIAWHRRGRSRPIGSARRRPVRLVASVSASRRRLLAEAEGLEPPSARCWRPPLLPLSYTSSANANKKAASVDPGRLAYLGLVVGLFQDIDKHSSPPAQAQTSPLRSQYWPPSLASDRLCFTINMGASFYAR